MKTTINSGGWNPWHACRAIGIRPDRMGTTRRLKRIVPSWTADPLFHPAVSIESGGPDFPRPDGRQDKRQSFLKGECSNRCAAKTSASNMAATRRVGSARRFRRAAGNLSLGAANIRQKKCVMKQGFFEASRNISAT